MEKKKIKTENKVEIETKKLDKKDAKNIISSTNKIKDLKIELLKNLTKRKSIKREIARLLTITNQTKLNGDKK